MIDDLPELDRMNLTELKTLYAREVGDGQVFTKASNVRFALREHAARARAAASPVHRPAPSGLTPSRAVGAQHDSDEGAHVEAAASSTGETLTDRNGGSHDAKAEEAMTPAGLEQGSAAGSGELQTAPSQPSALGEHPANAGGDASTSGEADLSPKEPNPVRAASAPSAEAPDGEAPEDAAFPSNAPASVLPSADALENEGPGEHAGNTDATTPPGAKAIVDPERRSRRRGRRPKPTVEELRARYLEVIGRPTESYSRTYLNWKLQEARLGRVTIGPLPELAQKEKAPPLVVLNFRISEEAADALDRVWQDQPVRNRNEFLRLAVAAYLEALGAAEEARLFSAA